MIRGAVQRLNRPSADCTPVNQRFLKYILCAVFRLSRAEKRRFFVSLADALVCRTATIRQMITN